MIQEFKLLLTVRHTDKEIYWCMSQYPSIKHTITNVKHLSKLRYVQYTASTLLIKGQ